MIQENARVLATLDLSSCASTVIPFPGLTAPGERTDDVERINQYAFYELGHNLHQLSINGDVPVGQALFLLMNARNSLQQLMAGFPVKLELSTNAANELNNALGHIWTQYFEKDGQFSFPDANTKPIQSWQWGPIVSKLQDFENVLRAEFQSSLIYFVPDKGLSSKSALVEHAEKAFPPDLYRIIGEKAMNDFKFAAKCYAFGLPTASGYHSARAVEAVIEIYYQTFLNKPGATLNGWHDYVEALKKLATKKPKPKCIPDPRTLLSIDEIRLHHRNPLMHPRVVLSDTDADILLSIAKVAIVGMALEIAAVWSEKKAIEIKITKAMSKRS